MAAFKSIGYLAVVAAFMFARAWMRYEYRSSKRSPESALLEKIQNTASSPERQKLITELEAMPNKEIGFFYLWMTINDAWQFEGWTDSGFDPSLAKLPRNIQLLAAAELGVAEIDNGGLSQFFGNDTAMMAPEIVEWFDRAGMPECAELMRRAMSQFGAEYPRSQITRRKFLAKFERDNPSQPDPFGELDDAFFKTLEGKGETNRSFEATADRWLRETCGITRLSDPLSAAR